MLFDLKTHRNHLMIIDDQTHFCLRTRKPDANHQSTSCYGPKNSTRCGVRAPGVLSRVESRYVLYPTHQQHKPLVTHLDQHLADLLASWEEQRHTFFALQAPNFITDCKICTCEPQQR